MEAVLDRANRRILLAIDQSGSSHGATREAINRAASEHAALIVLSVQEARHVGVPATYLIWDGDPAETILEAALAEHADVIILGSRPRTNLRRLILGSVSSEVSRRATCEVVVVPA
jgi:nucleotide-binding universal stress UspA family protein